MMSYGWAILIIVIVAAALYGFGVFNPSSSSSGGTTGFAGLGSVIGVCYSNGTVSMQLGNSQGNSINITAINITSSQIVGQVVAYPNKAISPEGSIIYSVNSACPTTSGSSYSVKVYVTYKEVSSPFQSLYFSSGTLSGTVAGAAGPLLPAGVTTYSKISIMNVQSSGVSGPFQQMINLSLSSIVGYINNTGTHSFQNVEFFNRSNDAIIKSWLENYSFSKNWALYWIVLPNGISALTVMQDVAVGFASKATNLFNKTNDGEAPQLSSTYGHYDDGANVFSFYDNFSGTSLDSKWATSDSGGKTVSNGLSITAGSVYTSAAQFLSLNNIVEAEQELTASTPAGYGGLVEDNSQGPQGGNAGSNAGVFYVGNNVGDAYTGTAANGLTNSYNLQNAVALFTPVVNQYYIIGSFVSSAQVGELENYNTLAFASGTTFNTNQYIILGYFAGSISGTNAVTPIETQWVRVRVYPPNGIMPTAVLGSLSES